MAISGDIYQNMQGPDIMGSVERGLKMSDMLQQRQMQRDEQARQAKVNEALSKGLTVTPEGQVSVNPQTLTELTGVAKPQELMQISAQIQEQRKLQLQDAEKKVEKGLNLAQAVLTSAEPEKLYGSARSQLLALGLDPKEVPEKFDKDALTMLVNKGMSVKDQIAQFNKQQEMALDKQVKQSQIAKNYADVQKSKAETPQQMKVKPTKAQEKVDAEYAKDYNDFTGGGQQKALDALNKLKLYKQKLDRESKSLISAGGGPISGSLPDVFRTQESIDLRDNIQSVANSALKATFGVAGITDSERKALAAEFYNDKLDASRNAEILDRKIKELEAGLVNSREKARYYEQFGTLQGFKSQGKDQEQAPQKPSWAVD